MRPVAPCPKCGGNLFPERQLGGDLELCCLQCGRTVVLDRSKLAPRGFHLPDAGRVRTAKAA
jgi:hypothetical protein